jgi:phospholipase C
MPSTPTAIQHVFVLMLENRSFDHMLGFSGITGTNAETGQPTQIDGLSGNQSNDFAEVIYPVTQPADLVMPVDPSHEFTNVVTQLCGMNAKYVAGGPYPAVNNSGFVLDYFASGGGLVSAKS